MSDEGRQEFEKRLTDDLTSRFPGARIEWQDEPFERIGGRRLRITWRGREVGAIISRDELARIDKNTMDAMLYHWLYRIQYHFNESGKRAR